MSVYVYGGICAFILTGISGCRGMIIEEPFYDAGGQLIVIWACVIAALFWPVAVLLLIILLLFRNKLQLSQPAIDQ